jgi:uncharacterized membrane protein YiaA
MREGLEKMESEISKDRWKNRRRMAWITLFAGCLYPLLVLFSSSDQLGSIAGPFYVFVTGVIAVYIGAAVVDDNNFKESK